MPGSIEDVEELGFAVVAGVVPAPALRELVAVFEAGGARPGRRAFAVRATLFDKTAACNWPVAWHQDVTIPVRERRCVAGFEAWTSKGGAPHVRPPARVLASMLAVRIHLDGSNAANGPLRVVPGSHRHGILGAGDVRCLARWQATAECHVPAGGALLMRPLLVHASSRARAPSHRRVIHLEFAAEDLPGGLAWPEQGALFTRSATATHAARPPASARES
jgi:ectoine hydroxylase-related dioxygenase (phytanoyl-CoA dioxygenase family)